MGKTSSGQYTPKKPLCEKLFARLSSFPSASIIMQLPPSELKELASCFPLRAQPSKTDNLQIRYIIEHLPQHFRASKVANLLARAGLSKKLCAVHEGLDPHIVSTIFDSLRIEVLDTVQSLGQYAYLLGPDENMTLDRIAGMEGMWRESIGKIDDRLTKRLMRWKYQSDQCQACMISRVASNPSALRELRTLILAKMGGDDGSNDKSLHRKNNPNYPLILSLVTEWIMLTDQSDELFYLSGQRASVIKDTMREWKIMQETAEENDRWTSVAESVDSHTLADSVCRSPKMRLSTTPQSTPSLTPASNTPDHSSLLSRPRSRDDNGAQGFADIEFLLQNYSFDMDTDSFRLRLPPLGERYQSSVIFDYSHRDSMNLREEEEEEYDVQNRFNLTSTLSDYMHNTWPSANMLLDDPRSQFRAASQNLSSHDTFTSFTIRPEVYEMHNLPESGAQAQAQAQAEMPNNRSTVLPPLRAHSPLLILPFTSSSASSQRSPPHPVDVCDR